MENLGENVKNIRNQGGKLSIAVKMIYNGNGNDKFKEWKDFGQILYNDSLFLLLILNR